MTRYPRPAARKEIFRQITQANVAVVAADGDILNDAIELKIIPRPRVGHQLRQRVIVHFQSRRETLLQALQPVMHQRRNTVASGAQRG